MRTNYFVAYLCISAVVFHRILSLVGDYEEYYDSSGVRSEAVQQILYESAESILKSENEIKELYAKVLSDCLQGTDGDPIQCDTTKSNFTQRLDNLEKSFDPRVVHSSISRELGWRTSFKRDTGFLLLIYLGLVVVGLQICWYLPRQKHKPNGY